MVHHTRLPEISCPCSSFAIGCLIRDTNGYTPHTRRLPHCHSPVNHVDDPCPFINRAHVNRQSRFTSPFLSSSNPFLLRTNLTLIYGEYNTAKTQPTHGDMSVDKAGSAIKSTQPPRRGRGRPRKKLPQPNSKGLPALPPELIGKIASFLIPAPTDPDTGFAPPTEYAYGSKKGITLQPKSSRYGGIPSGIRDVLNFAQTCKACDAGVDSVVGKIGDGSTEARKRYVVIGYSLTIWLKIAEPSTFLYRWSRR